MDNVPLDPSEMAPMSQEELDETIKKHGRYMRGELGGARAVLQYRNLSGLNFSRKDLSQADFTGSLFREANMVEANFKSTSFFACDLRNANLRDANLSRVDFRGAYVSGADLTGADMTDADMREGKVMKRGKEGSLEDQRRPGGDGSRTVFAGAKMADTNMAGVQATQADFSDADMTGVSLTNTSLEGANFVGANLAEADMTGADLSNANLRDSVMTGAVLAGIEDHGMVSFGAVTEADMGNKLENLGKTLAELLEEHTLWVSTAGKVGRQLDLNDYDLRDVMDLRKFPLTAIAANGAIFIGQDLRQAEMQSGAFDRADFRDCDMGGSDLRGSSFKYGVFTRVNMKGAKLCPLEFRKDGQESRLKRVDMSGSIMKYSNFESADLRDCILMGVDLTNSNLKGADLRRADLTGAILDGANLDGAKLDGTTIELVDS